MSRSLVMLAASLVLLLVPGGCGKEAPPPPVDHGAEDAAPEAGADPERLSRLEELHLQVRTCVAVGGAGVDEKIREIYREILAQLDPDDREARRYLDYADFQADVLGRLLEHGEDPVPEAIANREGYDFLDAVVDFHHERWLRDPESIERAHEVVAAMRAHVRKLEEDPVYRLGDSTRGNVATDPNLGDLCHTTSWAPPHLVCYATGERLSDFDLLKVPDWKGRQALRAKRQAGRRALQPKAEAVARVLTQLHDEFLRRYGERYGLKPLTAPYGGRPDYKPGVRSYADGVPLCVLVLEDQKAYQEFHIRHRGAPRNPSELGYFLPTSAWIFTFDEPGRGEDRNRQLRAMLRLGTYQLLHWFARQRNAWGASAWGQDCVGAGLAGDLSAARIGEDLAIEFTSLNVDLLKDAQGMAAQLRKRDQVYPLRPLKELIGITSYGELTPRLSAGAGLRASASYGSPRGVALKLYFQQSWMFVRFLQEYDGGRYREGFERYLEAYLSRKTQFGMALQAFLRSLGIEDKDWARLDEEFRGFVDDLLERELP